MIAIIDAFQALYHDEELNKLMDEIRGKKLVEQTIFQLEIDEDFLKVEKAPLIRIEDIDSHGAFYNDDKRGADDESIQISTMAQTVEELADLLPIIDEAMKRANFEQYNSKIYRETDLGLMYNARSYRRINYL
ncbi:hypothetical protein BMT55_16145 [Listeria newyorkensis]|uniref:Uncharacterized protein n=1 Tax=Listeria newyorkensis TaxID=1497681 RepID=A0ABX4XIH8_9LIST|nr:hypothetical protein [Listeria newyorkensis]PNP87454.1 hypothetical protein BMT55_16145 [Listeria newyorkensis]